MFDEDGSLDPLLKFVLVAVFAFVLGKMLWTWLTGTATRWITVDLWDLIAGHPWWTGLSVVGALLVFSVVGRLVSLVLGACAYVGPQDLSASVGGASTEVLTFTMRQLSSVSAVGFEQACADLLARDGFGSSRRVGGAGDLGVDVTARDGEGRLLIVQCKQYRNPVGSGHVQQFNGTARPHHGADIPIMVALNGFTQPAVAFAQRHQLILMGGTELRQWAHGQHLYDVLGIASTGP
ncbi:restriction endonuclease [Streptomyces zagrosensis]|uniref:restriction endonuclease n=1 Tax=Streptomyces zagrosensis TaxID=1042984 RepID=UPI0016103067